MDKDSRIYVAGHTGLVGSAIMRRLNALGCANLAAATHAELDLTDRAATEVFFRKEKPDYVFLAAARVGGIQANNAYPAEFIFQNLMIEANVIDLSHKYGVRKLMFLGSSCIYPKICPQPIKEDYLFTGPIEPTNEPYAVAKLAGLKMCESYKRQYGANFISIIPANVYGINDNFEDGGHVVAATIKKFHEAAAKGLPDVTIWGTGRPRREFLYVDDLANACVFLMDDYDGKEFINVGIGADTSIAELAETVKRITGFKGEIVYDASRPDGMPQRLLDSTRMSGLGWRPKTVLDEGLRTTYEWYKARLEK